MSQLIIRQKKYCTTSGTEETSLGIPEFLGALHLEYVHQQSGSVEEYSIPLKSPAAVP